MICSASSAVSTYFGRWCSMRQHDLGSWIVQEMILVSHPLKDTLDGLQSGVLRAEAEWGWPLVLREPVLGSFEDRPRDLGGLAEAAFLAHRTARGGTPRLSG